MNSRLRLLCLAVAALCVRLFAYAWIAIPFGGFVKAACVYDCVWYVRLGAEGYGSSGDWTPLGPVPNWAFFPLFPILIRLVMQFGASAQLAGLVVSNTLLLGFVMLGAEWLRRTRTPHSPALWVLFVLLFPFGFIFSVPYTESLFDVLMVAALLAMADRRRLLAAVIIAAMCATRPNGVVMLPLLLLLNLRELIAAWPITPSADRAALLGEALLPLVIAPLGLSLFMAYQYWYIGDALAFNHVQLLWDRTWTGPLYQLSHALHAWDWGRVLAIDGPASETYNAAWSLFGLAIALWLAWQRRFTEAYLLAIGILLPLSTAIHSMPRFVATNPAFLFAMFDIARKAKTPSAQIALSGAFGLAQSALMVGWYQSANALF